MKTYRHLQCRHLDECQILRQHSDVTPQMVIRNFKQSSVTRFPINHISEFWALLLVHKEVNEGK